MIIAIIILAYIPSVFLNRWLNKKCYQSNHEHEIAPFVWFFSLVVLPIWIGIYIIELLKKSSKSNWFTGKNW